MKVAGKKVILTGAGSGMGKEMAKELLNRGAFVIGLDINEASLQGLHDELKSENLATYVVDMGSAESICTFKDTCTADHGPIDALINNAGIIQPFVGVKDLDDETIDRVMRINFNGPVLLTRLFLNELLSRPEGHIVNVSSMGGFFPFPGQTIYGASKGALKQFTEGLFAETRGTNLDVTIVFPGAIATNISVNSGLEVAADATEGAEAAGRALPAPEAAKIILDGMEQAEFQVYVGQDAIYMNGLYKEDPEKAIAFINEQMGGLRK